MEPINGSELYDESKFFIYVEDLDLKKIKAPIPMFRNGHPIEYFYFIEESKDEFV
jgi:hypothetical protein